MERSYKTYIYGAGGHGKVVCEVLELMGVPVSGFLDDNFPESTLMGYRVIRKLPSDANQIKLIMAVGDNMIRKRIIEEKHFKLSYATVVHPSANLSTRCRIGIGTVVMAGVSVNTGAVVGRHVILNTSCSVDHDCVVGNFVHISPNAALAGNVTIGEGSQIGIGACVIPGVKIGKWCLVGAGAVITKDVEDYSVVAGNPGKLIRKELPRFITDSKVT